MDSRTRLTASLALAFAWLTLGLLKSFYPDERALSQIMGAAGLGEQAGPIVYWAVAAIEYFLAVALAWPRSRLLGLWMSFAIAGLMLIGWAAVPHIRQACGCLGHGIELAPMGKGVLVLTLVLASYAGLRARVGDDPISRSR